MTRRIARAAGAPCRRGGRGMRGTTLLEILIGLLVFSFGLLGLVGLHARALHFSTSAEDTNRAALLANEIAAEMLTNQAVTLPSAKITSWQTRVANPLLDGLPNGQGDVAVDAATGLATITIRWRPPRAASGAANGESRYVTQVKVVT